MTQGYVVEFKLPTDAHLFIRHGTNVEARNAKEAVDLVRPHLPAATFLGAHLGMVMLYGRPWCTWDATRGAECAPAEEEFGL